MTTLDPERIPQHIAIIMDGNGRWAKARGLDRSLGHQEGAATVRDITEEASNLGVKFLTLYTFSTENWSRPEREVATLMALIIDSLEEELFMANNVRLRVIGDRTPLPDFVCRALERCERNTAANSGMTMVLALSYSARGRLPTRCGTLPSALPKEPSNPRTSTSKPSGRHSKRSSCPTPNSSSEPAANSD